MKSIHHKSACFPKKNTMKLYRNGEGYRMRLIDADALEIRKAKREIFSNPSFADGWNSVIDIIQCAPTVNAEPIRQGHWIYKDYCVWICSECRENPTRGLGFVQAEEHLYEYCPHCGAKMDGGGMSGND